MTYQLLLYLHILLFVFWLGTDVGVYYAGKYTTLPDLTAAERRRFLSLLLRLDMGPRTALVLMVPGGIHLAAEMGYLRLGPATLAAVWVAGLGWLGLVWWSHLRGTVTPRWVGRVDYAVRYLVVAAAVGIGAWSLAAGGPVRADWLAAKTLLFGVVVALGLALRATVPPWVAAIGRLENPAEAGAAQAEIERVFRMSGRLAHALWVGVAAIAALGVFKPSL